MFYNHTKDSIFERFEQQYNSLIHNAYPHIAKLCIHCYTIEQYSHLHDVQTIHESEYDTFAFAFNGIHYPIFAAIIYAPPLCEQLKFTDEEMFAAIAHEIGHIIHCFNVSLKDAGDAVIEIKADEVVVQLGLKDQLKAVLNKLKSSNLYSQHQCNLMNLRLKYIDW